MRDELIERLIKALQENTAACVESIPISREVSRISVEMKNEHDREMLARRTAYLAYWDALLNSKEPS